MSMHKVVHHGRLEEARLIQRMLVWAKWGCSLSDDPVFVQKELFKKNGVALLDGSKVVARGFWEAVDYLRVVDGKMALRKKPRKRGREVVGSYSPPPPDDGPRKKPPARRREKKKGKESSDPFDKAPEIKGPGF